MGNQSVCADLTSSLALEPDDPMTLSEMRAWARHLFGPSEDLALLLTELVANAREHGVKAPISIDIARDADSLRVVITNQGTLWPPVSTSSDASNDVISGPSSLRGRGLHLARAVSDELRIEQLGTTVKVVAVISPSETFHTYRFDKRFEPVLRVLGVRPDRDGVLIEGDHLTASFGIFSLDTPIANIVSAEVSGPYRWFKAIGPRLSVADKGLTFGTNAAKGVCLKFETPIPAVVGPWPHPGLTLTVQDPERFVTAIDKAKR